MKTRTDTTYITDDGREFRSESEAKEHEAGMTERNRLHDEFVKAHPFVFNVGDIVRLHENGNLYAVCRRETIVVNVKNLDCGNTYWLGRVGDLDDDREQAYEYVYERDGGKPVKEQATLIMTADQADDLRGKLDAMMRVICGARFDEMAKVLLMDRP